MAVSWREIVYRLCVRIVRNRAYKSGYYLFQTNKLSLGSDNMNCTIYYTLYISEQIDGLRMNFYTLLTVPISWKTLYRVCRCSFSQITNKQRSNNHNLCTHQCTSYTEEILQAFHIGTKKDSPEILPPGFMQTPYKCSVDPYDLFSHCMEKCS